MVDAKDRMVNRHDLEASKLDAAIGNRVLVELGLASGIRASLGHTSMRVPNSPDVFVVKGRGYRTDLLSRVRPEDMVVCDLDGNWLDGPPYSIQCSEVKIHSCIYRARPDVVSVTHVHPDYIVLMSVLGQALRPMAQEGANLVLEDLPVLRQTRIIVSEEEGQRVVDLLGSGHAVLMLGHGAVTVSSSSVEDSVMSMALLEHQARLNYMALAAVGSEHPTIPLDLAAAVGQQRASQQPHLAARLADVPGGSVGKVGSVWAYYRETILE